jgi:hypothetical protein
MARRPGSIWSKYNVGWPFGCVEADESALTFSYVGPLAGVFSALSRSQVPAAVPLAAIERIEVAGRRFVTVVIRSTDPRFEGAIFSARGATLQPVLDRLASAGVTIAPRKITELAAHR